MMIEPSYHQTLGRPLTTLNSQYMIVKNLFPMSPTIIFNPSPIVMFYWSLTVLESMTDE